MIFLNNNVPVTPICARTLDTLFDKYIMCPLTHLVPEPPEERHVLARGRDLGELPGKVLGHGRLVGGRVQEDHAHAAGH